MPASRRIPRASAPGPEPATAVGTVASATGRSAVVEVTAETCPRCAAGQGCGAGILAGSAPTLSMSVPLADGVSVSAGDRVYLSIEPGSLLRGAFCLYGLPLIGLLVGAATGLLAGVADGLAAVLGAAGLAGGLLLGRSVARRDPCLSTLRPSISGRADESGRRGQDDGFA